MALNLNPSRAFRQRRPQASQALNRSCIGTYLMVGNSKIKTRRWCGSLLRALNNLRRIDVANRRAVSCEKVAGCTTLVTVGALAITALTGGASAPVTLPVAVGSAGVAAGSKTTQQILSTAEADLRRERSQNFYELIGRFPILRELSDYFFGRL
ncbi:hypothetical protein BX600DRAFT_525423 [Xylariales sp. PMI_506]|nr:hypothetical protein BX600DRAFT_525423 [Xylariales sp. PMI_506]